MDVITRALYTLQANGCIMLAIELNIAGVEIVQTTASSLVPGVAIFLTHKCVFNHVPFLSGVYCPHLGACLLRCLIVFFSSI